MERYRAIMARLLDIKWDKWFNGPHSTNKVRNKETNGQIHGRDIQSGWDSKQGCPYKKLIP